MNNTMKAYTVYETSHNKQAIVINKNLPDRRNYVVFKVCYNESARFEMNFGSYDSIDR